MAAAKSSGTTPHLTAELHQELAKAAAEAQLDPDKAEVAARLLTAVEAFDVGMGEA